MYDKAGSVLRIEMVINEPEGFTVRKEVMLKRKKIVKWVDMLKGVAYLFRYTDVSLASGTFPHLRITYLRDPWTMRICYRKISRRIP
jgi:hypothetical protein